MELLAIAGALALLGGCYSPSLRDCTVSCESGAQCLGDQICGADGLCAAPDVAGHCAMTGGAMPDAPVKIELDAGAASDAATALDAALEAPPPAPPDAATTATLRVQIDGAGAVLVDGRGACTAAQDQHGDCSYEVPLGVAVTARALASQLDQRFVAWISATCQAAGATCTFTPTASVTIVAKFDKVP